MSVKEAKIGAMSNPLVSICIPAHNPPLAAFKKCLDSVINQTYKNLEIVISDDSGKENLKDAVAKFDDPRIVYLSKEAEGVHANREFLLHNFKGDYFAFIDSDDYVDPTYIEYAVRGMSHSDDSKHAVVFLDKHPLKKANISPEFSYSIEKRDDIFLELVGYSGYYVWGKLFPRDLVYGMKIRLEDGGDDVQVMQKCADRITNIVRVHGTGYHYTYNQYSISHSTNQTYLFNYLTWLHAKKLIWNKYHRTLPEIEISVLIAKATLEAIDFNESFQLKDFKKTSKEMRKYHRLYSLKLDRNYTKKAYLLKYAPTLFKAIYRKKLLGRKSGDN